MRELSHLFRRNLNWVDARKAEDPAYFDRLANTQSPTYLWIGCSDSRVPANVIIDLPPGEVFVHRNVANVVVHSDLNCLSVLQYAVEVLKVRHVIVCGHYGCGGVRAVLDDARLGLIDNWLRHVHDVKRSHEDELSPLKADARFDRLCELNVMEQVRNVATTSIVQGAWERGQELYLHGCIYGVKDGILRDLGVHVHSEAETEALDGLGVGTDSA